MPLREALDLYFARAHAASLTSAKSLASKWAARIVGVSRWPALPTGS